MAFDLLFGKTKRDWSRSRDLIADPSLPAVGPTPTKIADALSHAIAASSDIAIERRGRGGFVSKRWGWG